jgi:hypothetical protein
VELDGPTTLDTSADADAAGGPTPAFDPAMSGRPA